ncbi:hypothetical protein GCM10022223_33010 [Kineosporia mesophila]|uniref:HTH araC/xylS-type domain-containing protein n=1 Tax=Kineosporia mesophila TaxID=566012 RepID=A0ABP6ZQA2_9ACTN|nr:helix-turn-helix domain-containing protein [Kineosporia mesophila]MCD5353704.1 helix-turn-helix domain-containing protein [Kineosporia mesophila]
MVITGKNGELRLYAVHHGSWALAGVREETSIGHRRFLLRRSIPLTGFEIAPETTAHVIGMPAEALPSLLDDAELTGSLTLPEARLLLSHLALTHELRPSLSNSGAQAARDAVVELLHGLLHKVANGNDANRLPSLVQLARRHADEHLQDPDLSPAAMARELHISVRSLHRAFAATGESAMAYVRRRRLEGVRRDLALGSGRSLAKVAVRWQFTDSSHLNRTFVRHYGLTPAQFTGAAKPCAAGCDETSGL